MSTATVKAQLPELDPAGSWKQISELVQTRFLDPELNGLNWESISIQTADAINADPSRGPQIIRKAIALLEDGHTAYFTPNQRAYYELLDVFYPEGLQDHPFLPNDQPVRYTGVGLVAEDVNGAFFARDVYPGGPAADAGVLPGDELVEVDGQPWGDIVPFLGAQGEQLTITIRRNHNGPLTDIAITPESIQPSEMFLAALELDIDVVESEDHSIGYIRTRTHTNHVYNERAMELIRSRFKDADALIFDMRGGWGGGSLNYLELFNPMAPAMTMIPREGEPSEWRPSWGRPITVIIDGGCRSSKELLAHAFKKHPRATVVGTTTAGAVTAGSLILLDDGSVLYLGVADVRVDGVRLEQVGVQPDITVPYPISYTNGVDPQRNHALQVTREALHADGEHEHP